ncbi:MAG TPA: glycosyltransferase family 9 protein [Patescibacteria group bacterium]|nr:glycosyltransferase family 9 protein [Patescibacteria group bacterium]
MTALSNKQAQAAPVSAPNQAVAQAYVLHQQAVMLEDEHQYEEAIACMLKALTLGPQIPEIHLEMALLLLRRGEFGPGLLEYEWRWRLKERANRLPRFGVPQWNGMRLPRGRIVLHADQGAGDKVQFCRYIPMVAERCREVFVTSAPSTAKLLQGVKGVTAVTTDIRKLPPVDVFCTLSSLPLVFDTRVDNIPDTVPYLSVEPEKVSTWKSRLDQCVPAGSLRVGISWAGSAEHIKDKWRSTRLEQWSDVLGVPDVAFISLQKEVPEADRLPLASENRLIDFTSELGDFSDTAALIQNLDLVLSVDTSVTHLAGALGKPAWVLLQWVPDWRWLMDREDSPWYPTMRLYRQEVKDDYSRPLQRIAHNLRNFCTTASRKSVR